MGHNATGECRQLRQEIAFNLSRFWLSFANITVPDFCLIFTPQWS